MLPFDDRELVDGNEVVMLRMLELDEPNPITGNCAVGTPVLDFNAIDKHPVKCTIVSQERRGIRADGLLICLFASIGGNMRIKSGNGVSQPRIERDILICHSLGFCLAWGDQRAVKDGVAKLLE